MMMIHSDDFRILIFRNYFLNFSYKFERENKDDMLDDMQTFRSKYPKGIRFRIWWPPKWVVPIFMERDNRLVLVGFFIMMDYSDSYDFEVITVYKGRVLTKSSLKK